MEKPKLLILLVCFILGATSSCTTYKKMGFTGGFDETRLGENIWRVNARGNAYASEDLIANMVMMRSADLAFQNGFSHFAFASGSTSSKTGVIYDPGTTYTTGNENTFGNSATYNATTQSIGSSFTYYSKPSAQNTVVMFREKPKNFNGIVYATSFICRNLGKKLKSECGKIK